MNRNRERRRREAGSIEALYGRRQRGRECARAGRELAKEAHQVRVRSRGSRVVFGVEGGCVAGSRRGDVNQSMVIERVGAQTARLEPAWVRRLSFLAFAKSDWVEGTFAVEMVWVEELWMDDMLAVGDEEAACNVNDACE